MDEKIHKHTLFQVAMRMTKDRLNETQQFVVMQFMKGVPQSKTAKILHTSQSEISKILKTSICLLSLQMKEEGYTMD